ncbi:outer membrane protein [Cognatiyoonia sp. IB215182]|uniref:outer membrane protein n=1 Tax=Cognatiyoonia sp. IB215182 TaxID=3097353 RepID=UPI002A24E1B4|nr:outer membrane beta-barrel protein [Cognatiyoonia sp. IB215182]
MPTELETTLIIVFYKAVGAAIIAALPCAAAAEWSGVYAGAALGSLEEKAGASAFAGAQYQYSSLVAGLELEYTKVLAEDGIGSAELTGFTTAALRLGWSFDEMLVYFSQGVGSADEDNNKSGDVIVQTQFGIDYQFDKSVVIGAQYEVAGAVISALADDEPADLDSFRLRVAYQF